MATSKSALADPQRDNTCILIGRKLSPLKSLAELMGKQLKRSGLKDGIGLLGTVSTRADPSSPTKKQIVFYFSSKPRGFNKMFASDMRKLLLRISTTWVIPLLRNAFVTLDELTEEQDQEDTSQEEEQVIVDFFNSLIQDEDMGLSQKEINEIHGLVVDVKLNAQIESTMSVLKRF